MITCSVPGCNNAGNPESGITRHSFPKSKSLRDEWIAVLQISNFQISDNNFVCSAHFRNEDFDRTSLTHNQLKEGVVPSIYLSSNENVKMEHLDIKDEPMEVPTSYVNVLTTENVRTTPTEHLNLNSVLRNDPLFIPTQAPLFIPTQAPLFIPTQASVKSEKTFLVLRPVGNDSQKPSLLISSNLLFQCGQGVLNQTMPIVSSVSTNLISSTNLNSKESSLSQLSLNNSASANHIICKPVIVKTAKYKVNVGDKIKCNAIKKGKSNNVEQKTATSPATNVKSPLDSKTETSLPISNCIHINKNNLKSRANAPELPPPLIEETKVKDIEKCSIIEKFSGYFILDGFNDNPKNIANFNLQHILSLVEVIDGEKKKFTCKLCLHQCAIKKNIIRHIRTKHNENEGYKCHYCQYETSFEANLEKHFKTVHNKDY